MELKRNLLKDMNRIIDLVKDLNKKDDEKRSATYESEANQIQLEANVLLHELSDVTRGIEAKLAGIYSDLEPEQLQQLKSEVNEIIGLDVIYVYIAVELMQEGII